MGAPPTASPAKVGLFLPSLQALSRGRLILTFPFAQLGFGIRRVLLVGSLYLPAAFGLNLAYYTLQAKHGCQSFLDLLAKWGGEASTLALFERDLGIGSRPLSPHPLLRF